MVRFSLKRLGTSLIRKLINLKVTGNSMIQMNLFFLINLSVREVSQTPQTILEKELIQILMKVLILLLTKMN
jgi:hypothetical protein